MIQKPKTKSCIYQFLKLEPNWLSLWEPIPKFGWKEDYSMNLDFEDHVITSYIYQCSGEVYSVRVTIDGHEYRDYGSLDAEEAKWTAWDLCCKNIGRRHHA